ncbi:hypothetical protein MVEN_00137500 [Mycena venus]|uniref:Uncharacterized protein n=1 Tax=Mycena venus TaxID=2733690 RepID=A0A8H7DAD8_9AGAR|nr:hypothetical protein MVEN_00137500 [Mycena venus]
MSDQIIFPTIAPLANATNPPVVDQAAAVLANMSLDNTDTNASDTDTDSTGSVPDLVPATDSDNNTSVNGDIVQIHQSTPVVAIDARAVNGINNPTQSMEVNPIVHHGPFASGHQVGGYRDFGVQTSGPSSPNWRAPPYLAHRAFRDVSHHPAFPQGSPVGNSFRRGGAPYHVHGGRLLNVEVINDLILRLQRVECALQGLADSTEQQYWFPRHF